MSDHEKALLIVAMQEEIRTLTYSIQFSPDPRDLDARTHMCEAIAKLQRCLELCK